jgi:type I restriction enzyme S subunit
MNEQNFSQLKQLIGHLPKSKILAGASLPNGKFKFYLSGKKQGRLNEAISNKDAIIMGDGGVASIAYAEGNYSYSSHNFGFFSENTSVLTQYIYRALEEFLPVIDYRGFVGSGIKNIDKNFLFDLYLQIPTLPEQKKIASILTSVDEVIDNTHKQIDKLKDLKNATMNELLTKGIGHTEFKDSELGRIPESWEIKSLSEISELSRGKFSHRPRNDPAFYNGRYPFLQTGDIPIDNLEITSFSQSLNEKGLQVSRLFPEGTLVLTIAATIGEIGLLKFDSCFPDSLVGINVNQAVVRKYFLLLSLRHWKERLILAAPESAQKNLNLDILNPFHVAVPPLNEQKEIESILISIQNHIEVKNNELSKFQSIKKSLMQDLLTGKVQVTVN